jgi:hypothetical protein
MGVTERRRRRRKEILNDLKKGSGYWKLKEEALDRTVWRTCFRRGYELVRQQACMMMIQINASLFSGI